MPWRRDERPRAGQPEQVIAMRQYISQHSHEFLTKKVKAFRHSSPRAVRDAVSVFEDTVLEVANVLDQSFSEMDLMLRKFNTNAEEMTKNLHSLKGQLDLGAIYWLWNKIEQSLPSFEYENLGINKWNEFRRIFFRIFDLDLFLWEAAERGQIDWEDISTMLSGLQSGKNIFGIEEGLEIYQGIFPFDERAFLPPNGQPCIYFLRDTDMNVLYVGQSKLVKQRLRTHWREQSKDGIAIWDVVRLRSFAVLDQEEHRMIMKHQPPYNKTLLSDRYSRNRFKDGKYEYVGKGRK
jgi:hypothetical protein